MRKVTVTNTGGVRIYGKAGKLLTISPDPLTACILGKHRLRSGSQHDFL